MSPLVGLALADGAVGLYLLWYAVRRQRENRDVLAAVALVLLVCALTLGYLAVPMETPRQPPPVMGELV